MKRKFCVNAPKHSNVFSATMLPESDLSSILLDAYIELGQQTGWTEQDMADNDDMFYRDYDHCRTECADFIAENYDLSTITEIIMEDDESEILIRLFSGDSEVGMIRGWFSGGRFDFFVER